MVGKLVSDYMVLKVSSDEYPSELRRAISVEDPKVEGGAHRFQTKGEINIVISLEIAPMAAAFEWGSGEHATQGTIGTYEIRPKDASILKFDWQPDFIPWKSPKFGGVIGATNEDTQGTYFFHWVDHPGVAPRPYIEPTVIETMDEVSEIITDGVVAQVFAGLDMTSEYMKIS